MVSLKDYYLKNVDNHIFKPLLALLENNSHCDLPWPSGKASDSLQESEGGGSTPPGIL